LGDIWLRYWTVTVPRVSSFPVRKRETLRHVTCSRRHACVHTWDWTLNEGEGKSTQTIFFSCNCETKQGSDRALTVKLLVHVPEQQNTTHKRNIRPVSRDNGSRNLESSENNPGEWSETR
jgi:hypothetical protein